MDRRSAFEALPAPYALALRLAGEGADHETIGAATHVAVDAVAALIEVGERKLAHLLGTPDPTGSDDNPATG